MLRAHGATRTLGDMNDVTAVVLTIGEPYTERALASLRRQTLQPAETIIIDRIAPFHRALNAGAAAVRTEFFIQVDADMILDETCIADLRACMSDRTGVVVARLRDPLQGCIPGVKLWRTRCWASRGVPDSVAQDVDFVETLSREGWLRVDVLKYSGAAAHWHSLGEHHPDYSPLYTFSKFRMEAARCRHRRDGTRLQILFQRLRTSAHSAALIGQIGVALGVFLDSDGDQLKPYVRDEDFDFLEHFIGSDRTLGVTHAVPSVPVNGDLRAAFARFSALGTLMRSHGAFPSFEAAIRKLWQEPSMSGLVASVGLCRGLFQERYTQNQMDEDFRVLDTLLRGCRA
jgi:hypothetical protein